MVIALQETGVHVAPSGFVDVGKKEPCPDEVDTISKTFFVRKLPDAHRCSSSNLHPQYCDRVSRERVLETV
jgi:hypothetical protein